MWAASPLIIPLQISASEVMALTACVERSRIFSSIKTTRALRGGGACEWEKEDEVDGLTGASSPTGSPL